MMWPFGRRGGKSTRLKVGGPAPGAERKRPVAGSMSAAKVHLAHEFARQDVLRSTSTRRASRRRRRSTRSSVSSLHDFEKDKSREKEPLPLAPFEAELAKDDAAPHRSSREDNVTALPNQRRLEQSPHLRPVSQQQHGTIPYNFQQHQSDSQSSLPTARERGKLQRPQSMRKPVNETSGVIRRLSSKKQKREHDQLREEEIRAMSKPLPQKRPAGNSGSMLRRESKKVKGNLNHRFERPESNIALPTDGSISSMSGTSDHRAYRVSAFDMFSPRPTVRCSTGSQYYSGVDSSPLSNKSRTSTQRTRRPVSGDDQGSPSNLRDKRSSRIDDLADDMDSGSIREIMERDKRRREKKRKADDERLRRRLERRAEKQRAAEAAQPSMPTTPKNEARDVTGLGTPPASPSAGKRPVGLGIEKDGDVTMQDNQPSTPRHRPSPLTPQLEENSQIPSPLESPMEEPVISSAQAIRFSRGSIAHTPHTHHTRGPSNVSEMPALLSERYAQEANMDSMDHTHESMASGSLHAVETTDTAATSKKGSDRRRSSEGRRMAIFASLFRRGKRRSQEQVRATPSASEISFSNTSRESMSRQPIPAHLVGPTPQPTAPITIKRPTNVPRRTRSKFKEDLPEFTPPESRLDSPRVIHNSAIAARRNQQPADIHVDSGSSGAARTDSPVSPNVPGAGVMSQSLASVDSEGSWLSGRPMNRNSNKSYLRSSIGSSAALRNHGPFNGSYEELGIPDDEYFKRLTPQPDEYRTSIQSSEELSKKPSSAAMATVPDDEEAPATSDQGSDEIVQNSVERRPTVIHHPARAVKSREGLLSFYHDDKSSVQYPAESAELVEADSPTSETEPVVQRAKSVDLGKHHFRHLSAGSAKLLDIQKRQSTSSQSKLTQQEQ